MKYLTPDWPAPPNVKAAVTLRSGGVSSPPYDSLNLAAHVGDRPEHVAENRRLLRASLALPAEPAWLEQVHGTRTIHIGREEGCPADASLADAPGQVCAVLTADCLPVLFASTDGAKVAAAHAGWRGLAAGVLETTIEQLATPPGHLLAWLGPAISQANFEVGAEVREAFVASDSLAASAFLPNERGRWQADLYALARQRLKRAGVDAVFGGGLCTYAGSAEFFSHRRDGRCGRMATLIWRD